MSKLGMDGYHWSRCPDCPAGSKEKFIEDGYDKCSEHRDELVNLDEQLKSEEEYDDDFFDLPNNIHSRSKG